MITPDGAELLLSDAGILRQLAQSFAVQRLAIALYRAHCGYTGEDWQPYSRLSAVEQARYLNFAKDVLCVTTPSSHDALFDYAAQLTRVHFAVTPGQKVIGHIHPEGD